MTPFEAYWQENMHTFKALAKEHFERDLLRQKKPFSAQVYIDSDDDFSLDIGYDFQVHGKTQKDVCLALIEKLCNAKFTYVNNWSMIDKDNVKTGGDYSHAWFSIRDMAIAELKMGKTSISFGGNQTISVEITEYANAFKLQEMGL